MPIDVEPELRAVAPTLFRQPVRCGAFVGAGWLPLLREACMKIESLALNLPEEERPVVGQIKEKFGELRFYVDCGTDEIHRIAAEAERQSRRFCEQCGCLGELRNGRWLKTLCDDCHAARGMR